MDFLGKKLKMHKFSMESEKCSEIWVNSETGGKCLWGMNDPAAAHRTSKTLLFLRTWRTKPDNSKEGTEIYGKISTALKFIWTKLNKYSHVYDQCVFQ